MFRLDISPEIANIVQKVKNKSIKLGTVCYVNWGARSGNVKKYVTDSPIDKQSKKMINARDIERYSMNYDNKYLWYKKEELYNPMFEELFEKPKLIVRDISGSERLKATYDEEKYYSEHTVSLCLLKHDLKRVKRRGIKFTKEEIEESKEWDLKYILGIFNSKLTTAYFKWLLGGGLHVYPDDVKNIMLFKPTSKEGKINCTKISNYVTKLLESKKQLATANTEADKNYYQQKCQSLDNQIDKLVYELYGLTEEEIKVVEGI